MRQHNSYTLNSKKPHSKRISKTFVTGLWIIICLLVIDFAVNFLFPYPSDPRITSPSQINRYFNYGRSIEGKLSQMLGTTDESSSAIAQAGWLDPELWKKLNLPTHPANSGVLVAVYGMSFSNHVADAMKEIDPKITLRMIAAPAAPANYAFAAYNKDRGRHNADVVMLGVLASSVKGLRAMNGMTWQFEGPAPYTYPKYFLEDGKLKQISPTITSLAELRAAFKNKQQWDAYTTQLRHNDEFFTEFLFSGFGDNSAIVRLIRRAWAQRHQKAVEDQIHSVNGFDTSVDIPVLAAIVTEFAASAKLDGKMPIVLLFNDRGYSDDLFRALEPTLTSASIPYVSTHNIAPASNLSNFIADGHFVLSANKEIAKAALKLVNNYTQHP